ncbi:MAG: protein kinase [Acidobacteria bacterium]|nr:protein kinase [Acidobacteriota bacterium]
MRECPLCMICFEDDVVICPNDGNRLIFSMPGNRMILDKYRLDALIGRGRMGSVYRATQIILMREVAIKVLSTQLFNNPNAINRFRTEALAVAKLDHPNIIKIYDYGTLPSGGAYMAMKLLKGYPLAQEMAFVRQMPFMRILRIMQPVCAGISVAHENHVVHCDLRPDNIILDNVDGQELVQIVDFGIAQLREISNSGTLYSVHTGAAEGAPSYMSPEQCLGEKLYYTSDIYSLGVILYQMLTGSVPFDSPIGADVALQHIKTPPPFASQRRLYVRPELDQVVIKAMEKSPKKRFSSAMELLEALECALKASEEDFLQAMQKVKRPIKPTAELDKNTNPLNPEMLQIIRDSIEKGEKGSAITSPLVTPPFKSPELVTTPNQEFSKIVALVVDDDIDIVETFNAIFESVGIQAITATDGEDAWKKAKQTKPHLIISDIIMPNVDGWQLFFRCKVDPLLSEIPFIFITGRDIEEEKVVALEQGAEDYWIKPFVVLEITVRLKRLLKRINKNLG